MPIDNDLCDAFKKKYCSGCLKDNDFKEIRDIIKLNKEHQCKTGDDGYCKECNSFLICRECEHKGFLNYLFCNNSTIWNDTIFCPKCKRLVFIHSSTKEHKIV